MTIGERIYKLRTEKGMTQDELALAVGYKSRSTIAKIESGERDPYQSMVVALANALGTTPSYLMGWEGDKKENAPIKQDRSDVINRINALPDDQFEKFAAKAEGYLDGLEDQ